MHRPVRPLAALALLLSLANCAGASEPAPAPGVASSRSLPPASPSDLTCLAEAIYHEATAAAESQQAVAHVVLNRAEDPRFPGSVCGVVRDGCQFSYRCSGKSLALSDPAKRTRAQGMAERALAGATDPTSGALFFHAASVRPGWFSTRSRVGEIGGNVFYR